MDNLGIMKLVKDEVRKQLCKKLFKQAIPIAAEVEVYSPDQIRSGHVIAVHINIFGRITYDIYLENSTIMQAVRKEFVCLKKV